MSERLKETLVKLAAGPVTERLSAFNPVNALGYFPALLAAAITKTRTLKEQAHNNNRSAARDWLIPGVGTYNWYKRMGAMHNSPEIEQLGIEEKKKDLARRLEDNEQAKVAGSPVTETLSTINPLNLYGGAHIGAITAAFTKTRTLKEQAANNLNSSGLKDLLVPGVGTYNFFKRIGASQRSPGMKKLMLEDKQLELKRKEEDLNYNE